MYMVNQRELEAMAAMDPAVTDSPIPSGSGGFTENLFIAAAKELFGEDVNGIQYKILKNSDFQELSLCQDGQTKLSFAIANGFRNIQNLVQKMKRKRCQYDFVEVMACPSGCLNGGAQVNFCLN